MKECINIYANAVMARFQNRRIIVIKDPKGVVIEFTNIIRGKKWKPVKVKRLKGAKVVTAIRLSNEAVDYLFNCYYHLMKKSN